MATMLYSVWTSELSWLDQGMDLAYDRSSSSNHVISYGAQETHL